HVSVKVFAIEIMLSLQLRLGGICKSSRIDRLTIPLFFLHESMRAFESDNKRIKFLSGRDSLKRMHLCQLILQIEPSMISHHQNVIHPVSPQSVLHLAIIPEALDQNLHHAFLLSL